MQKRLSSAGGCAATDGYRLNVLCEWEIYLNILRNTFRYSKKYFGQQILGLCKKGWAPALGGCAAVIQPPMAIVQMSLADLGRGAHTADVCLVLCDLPWCDVNCDVIPPQIVNCDVILPKMWIVMWFLSRCELWCDHMSVDVVCLVLCLPPWFNVDCELDCEPI